MIKELHTLSEAFKLKDKVKIISGPKDVIGKQGFIGEIRQDVSGKKIYTIDYEADGGKSTSIMVEPYQIRTVKEAMVHSKGIHIDYKGHGNFEVLLDGEKYEVYCPINIKGDHEDDSEWAGKFQVTKDGIRVPFTADDYEQIDKAFDELDVNELALHDLGGKIK